MFFSQGSVGGFDSIASGNPSLPLSEFITYDEMLISALIGVSCPTRFINSGSRDNRSRLGLEGSYETSGVICGMVGARFERYSRMESIFCFVDPDSTSKNAWAPYGPIPENGGERWELQRMWADFYGVPYFPTYEEARQSPDFIRVGMSGNGYFNCKLYKERMRISIDTFLLEANRRGAEEKRKVLGFVFFFFFLFQYFSFSCLGKVVAVLTGLGLGMWMKTKAKTKSNKCFLYVSFNRFKLICSLKLMLKLCDLLIFLTLLPSTYVVVLFILGGVEI